MSIAASILLLAAFINFCGFVAANRLNNLRLAIIFTSLILINSATAITLSLLSLL